MNHFFKLFFLFIFSYVSSYASKPQYLIEEDERTSILRMQDISRWYQPALTKSLGDLLQKTDQEKKGQIYTKEDFFWFLTSMQEAHPDMALTIRDLMQMTSMSAPKLLTPIPLDFSHVEQEHYILAPGFSHYYIDCVQQKALEESHRLSSTSQTLVQVADVGAGHGFATSRFLLTGVLQASAPQGATPLKGVRVTAMEEHTPLIKGETGSGPLMQIFKTTKDCLPTYAQTGARVSDYLTIRYGDAVKALALPSFKDFFDLCYLGNMIHYSAPQKAQQLVDSLFLSLKPGHKAYASVHTGLFFEELLQGNAFEIYEQQYKAGKKFPGWMMANYMAPLQDQEVGDYVERQLWPLEEETDCFSPTIQAAGWYKAPTGGRVMGEDGKFWAVAHRSLQIYDAISLKALFERSGLVTEDLFFQTPSGLRLNISDVGRGDGRFASTQDTHKASRVCIIARKPDLTPPTPATKG